MPFQIIRNDITKVKADAIVNTANPHAAVGDGVERAIYEAAGAAELLKARQKIGELAPGEVGITPAFKMPAKYIIHSSGPRWRDGARGEEMLLRRAYDRSLALAAEYQCKSIAFPLMATGTYGFPKELGLQIAVDAFRDFLMEHDMDITLVVFSGYAYQVSGRIFASVKSFVDNRYVGEVLAEEYRLDGVPTEYKPHNGITEPEEVAGAEAEAETESVAEAGAESEAEAGTESEAEAETEEETEAGEEETAEIKSESGNFRPWPTSPKSKLNRFERLGRAAASEAAMVVPEKKKPLENVLKEIYTDSFEKHLQQLINKKGLKNAEVYAAANISRQYFSKLLKGQVKPGKEKVLSLAVGLQLNLDEAVDFLRLAGYALSPISQTDAVVEYFIEKKDYNVMKIDIVLFDYGLEPLSS